MVTIVHDHAGYWTGIYRDGSLLRQGHPDIMHDLLQLLGIEHEIVQGDAVETGDFPDRLEDVVRRA